jgi:hypothetical protein
MAAHLRSQIRDAITGALVGLSTTGSSVFQSRVYPLEGVDLPALTVFTDSESSDITTMGAFPRRLERTLHLTVACFAQGVTGLDASLDEIARQVEAALAMPLAAIASLGTSISLTSSGPFDMVGTADKPVGRLPLVFEIKYSTPENAPDVRI